MKLKYWQKTYFATLALFLACLLGVIGGVLTIGQRLNFSATVNEALARQHYAVQQLAQDISTLFTTQPSALPRLYEYYGSRSTSDGFYLEIWQKSEISYTNFPTYEAKARPELTVTEGNRLYLVRPTQAGQVLFIAAPLPGLPESLVAVLGFSMEDFFVQWQRIATLFWLVGGGVSLAFAVALYLVLGRMYRPLAQVTQTARSLATGELSARAPAKRADEMGELGRAMNEMAQQVQSQIGQLQAAADEKQQLLDNLAHEMRTPLTAIGGWAETIQRAGLTGDELLEATDTILHESRRVLALSQQLLMLSVLRHEPLALEPVALAAVLKRAACAVEPKAQAQGVTLVATCPPGLPPLQADPVLLESLLINLADNGIKACGPGGQVQLLARQEAGRLCVTVTDTGRGMTHEVLAHLGQPFYRADKARSRAEGGAGLGLALCFEIAQRHGAALTFESQPGKGTVARLAFTV